MLSDKLIYEYVLLTSLISPFAVPVPVDTELLLTLSLVDEFTPMETLSIKSLTATASAFDIFVSPPDAAMLTANLPLTKVSPPVAET